MIQRSFFRSVKGFAAHYLLLSSCGECVGGMLTSNLSKPNIWRSPDQDEAKPRPRIEEYTRCNLVKNDGLAIDVGPIDGP